MGTAADADADADTDSDTSGSGGLSDTRASGSDGGRDDDDDDDGTMDDPVAIALLRKRMEARAARSAARAQRRLDGKEIKRQQHPPMIVKLHMSPIVPPMAGAGASGSPAAPATPPRAAPHGGGPVSPSAQQPQSFAADVIKLQMSMLLRGSSVGQHATAELLAAITDAAKEHRTDRNVALAAATAFKVLRVKAPATLAVPSPQSQDLSWRESGVPNAHASVFVAQLLAILNLHHDVEVIAAVLDAVAPSVCGPDVVEAALDAVRCMGTAARGEAALPATQWVTTCTRLMTLHATELAIVRPCLALLAVLMDPAAAAGGDVAAAAHAVRTAAFFRSGGVMLVREAMARHRAVAVAHAGVRLHRHISDVDTTLDRRHASLLGIHRLVALLHLPVVELFPVALVSAIVTLVQTTPIAMQQARAVNVRKLVWRSAARASPQVRLMMKLLPAPAEL